MVGYLHGMMQSAGRSRTAKPEEIRFSASAHRAHSSLASSSRMATSPLTARGNPA